MANPRASLSAFRVKMIGLITALRTTRDFYNALLQRGSVYAQEKEYAWKKYPNKNSSIK